jgi:hypothetical protein
MATASGLTPAVLQRRKPTGEPLAPWSEFIQLIVPEVDPDVAAALATGQPTGPARSRKAERDHAEAEAEAKRQQHAADRAAAHADAIKAETAKRLAEALQRIREVTGCEVTDDGTLAAAHHQVARILATLHADDNGPIPQLEAAYQVVTGLEDELRAKERAWSEIEARRMSCQPHADDPVDARRIVADLNDLPRLIVAAQAKAAEQRRHVGMIEAQINSALADAALAERQLIMRAIEAQIAEQQTALLATRARRAAYTGQRHGWVTAEFYAAINEDWTKQGGKHRLASAQVVPWRTPMPYQADA